MECLQDPAVFTGTSETAQVQEPSNITGQPLTLQPTTGVTTECRKLTLSLVDNESVITYYHLYSGLCPQVC